jgi:hypothetical protein
MQRFNTARVKSRTLRFESLEDRRVLSIVVSNNFDHGSGSLRAAITQSNQTGGRDEITFAAGLFSSGTPIINLETPISISDPVLLHSQNGNVQIQKASGFSPQEAFLIQPMINGTGQAFEISDLIIQNFTYGIRVANTGGVSGSSPENVVVDGNFFVNNERAIYLQDALFPFQISNNGILGRGIGASTNAFTDVGIYLDSSSTATNNYSPTIDNNFIGNHDDAGLFVNDVNIPNLSITNNQFGDEGSGTDWPNLYGIRIYDGNVEGGLISQNHFINNVTGAWIEVGDEMTIDDNHFWRNTTSGLDIGDTADDHVISNNEFIDNGNRAIRIGESTTDQSIHNRISTNYFEFSTSAGLPIDLATNGVIETNDTNDPDGGPNSLLNHPEFLESSIVDEGPQWKVPVRLDVQGTGQYRLEFYRYDPTAFSYTFIRAETRQLTGTNQYELQEDFYFQQGTELSGGQHLAVSVIRETGSSPSTIINDTSELVKTTNAFVDAAPRITDVVLRGSSWNSGVSYSYATIVPTGQQLAPIYTEAANTIQILFGEHVNVSATSLKLYRTGTKNGALNPATQLTLVSPLAGSAGFQYDAGTHIATWTFSTLPADKYRIEIAETGITDATGNLLDGEWLNDAGDDGFEDFTNDPTGRTFLTGNGLAGGAFQFLFSYLPGDYNQSGVVDAADETLYNDALFTADGNGDGVETAADHTVWTNHLGETLSLRRGMGDYNDDETTAAADYAVWRATYGSNSDLRADGNGNGVVDTADYVTWRYWEDTQGAWYMGFSGLGSQLPIVDLGNAPTVMNVTVSGLNSTHDAYVFGGPGYTGYQLQTVPVGGADTISITFSEDVNVTADNLHLVGLRTANLPTVADFAYDMLTMTATWRFDDLVANDHYLISLSDAVTDIEGNRLDGEWVNPVSSSTTNSLVSEFPSGDGNAGGNFNFVITLLAGDVNTNNIALEIGLDKFDGGNNCTWGEGDMDGDGGVGELDEELSADNAGLNLQTAWVLADLDGDFDVDDADLAILNTNLWMSSPTQADGDLNGDGSINAADLDLMFAQYGLELAVVS